MTERSPTKEHQRGPGRPFKKGVSGNPAGRPPGTGQVAQLRAMIAARTPAVIEAMVQKALEGDASAARLLLERAYAPLKATETPEAIPALAGNGGTLTDRGRRILDAVAEGALTATQAGQLLAGLGALARTAEMDELARRVAALEVGTDANAEKQG